MKTLLISSAALLVITFASTATFASPLQPSPLKINASSDTKKVTITMLNIKLMYCYTPPGAGIKKENCQLLKDTNGSFTPPAGTPAQQVLDNNINAPIGTRINDPLHHHEFFGGYDGSQAYILVRYTLNDKAYQCQFNTQLTNGGTFNIADADQQSVADCNPYP